MIDDFLSVKTLKDKNRNLYYYIHFWGYGNAHDVISVNRHKICIKDLI